MWDDFAEFGEFSELAKMCIRLIFAAILGGSLGWQRAAHGKDAGLRTYMLVALSAAFVVAVARRDNFDDQAMSRILQGLLTGIGFLGAGSILKLNHEQEVQGLTTAAGVWLTTTIGIAAGLGHLALATVVTLVAWMILSTLAHWSHKPGGRE